MSEYSTSSAAIEAVPTNQEMLANLIAAEFGAPAALVCSRELGLARQMLANTDDVLDLRRLLGSVTMTLPTIRASSLEAARSSLALAGTLPIQLRRELDAGLANAQRHLAQVERKGTTKLAVRALEGSGYTVRLAETGSTSAIEARRGHSVLLIAVAGGGAMQMDWAGHSGSDCEVAMEGVREAFAAEGLQITVRRRDHHGSAGGGSLITRAARAGNGDLVTGVLAAEGAANSTTTTQAPSRARLVQEA